MDIGHINFLAYIIIQSIDNLWIILVDLLLQGDHCLHPICYYKWIGLNVEVQLQPPRKAMNYRSTLPRLIFNILGANLALGPICMSKSDLNKSYMRI